MQDLSAQGLNVQAGPSSDNKLPDALKQLSLDEHLGDHVSKEHEFVDENGETVLLSNVLSKHRVNVLMMVYYQCPMLCNFIMNGMIDALKTIDSLEAGTDYQLISISIHPEERHELAKNKKDAYLESLGSKNPSAWRFLTLNPSSTMAHNDAKNLAKDLGYPYQWNPESQEYMHPAVSFVLNADGKITRYLYGLSHASLNVKLALVEAAQGTIGSSIDQFLLFCYRYNPDAKGYVLYAQNLMKVSGALFVLVLGLFLGFLRRMEKTT